MATPVRLTRLARAVLDANVLANALVVDILLRLAYFEQLFMRKPAARIPIGSIGNRRESTVSDPNCSKDSRTLSLAATNTGLSNVRMTRATGMCWLRRLRGEPSMS